ncbi:uncharacterized protein [Elaeis guineensis]|uniref:Uncharacterized protein LOC105032319 isoform X1 n=1 Tax=Elaeis guineensis var. tenera TaxID=51953 RepID=A0A6I9Q9F9_ELAGV|nr:uncharacterized protein LOC105032319 isoform X1 [Elaeis guineensis]
MADNEVAVLKEALCNQYIIIKKLYMELEEEREASATAASESLSMILRLQREKAVEKMEARQYKRMAEEKMHHADECLAILKEIMQQKEMEISILKYQLQAYKPKLLTGLNNGEIGTSESLFSCGINDSSDNASFHGFFRRNVSLPCLRLDKLCSEMDTVNGCSPLFPSGQSVWRKIGEYTSQLSERYKESERPDLCEVSVSEGHNSEEVNVKAKAESNLRSNEHQRITSACLANSGDVSTSCSWCSIVSGETSYHSTVGGIESNLDGECALSSASQAEDLHKLSECDDLGNSCLQIESNQSTVHSAYIHDIFEIPESCKGCNPSEPLKQVSDEFTLETKDMIGMPNLTPQEAADYLFKDDDWLSRAFMYMNHGSRLSTPKQGAPDYLTDMPSMRIKGASLNYHRMLVDPQVGTSTLETDFEQIKERLQHIDYDNIMKLDDSEKGKEQLKLLREIYELLNTIESHIRSFKCRKYPPEDDSPLVSVMEQAVLSFSI